MFLFDARQLRSEQITRGVKRGVASSVIKQQWLAAEIYPRKAGVHRDGQTRLPATRIRIIPEYVRGRLVRADRVAPMLLVEVIPGYTEDMKTAISVPDDTYEQATRQAQALGISRSEFFARAARIYLDQLASRSLTQQINEALETADDDSNAAAAVAGRSYLAGQGDW